MKLSIALIDAISSAMITTYISADLIFIVVIRIYKYGVSKAISEIRH
jgi:hypothetical protein